MTYKVVDKRGRTVERGLTEAEAIHYVNRVGGRIVPEVAEIAY